MPRTNDLWSPLFLSLSSDKPYFDYFEERRSDLVYLCHDSPNELEELQPDKIYIIGGLVNKDR